MDCAILFPRFVRSDTGVGPPTDSRHEQGNPPSCRTSRSARVLWAAFWLDAAHDAQRDGESPACCQMLAGQVKGAETKFYEGCNAKEILDVAKQGNCEELSCVLDPSTSRGFLVGFAFEDIDNTKIIIPGKDTAVNMIIYFVELEEGDFNRYNKMLQKHRQEQQDAMLKRRTKSRQPLGGTHDQ